MASKRVTRALLSVSDKDGLIDFARRLTAHSVELISTGGTARSLREAGLPVRDISNLTGFPEILGGRVKTLHPKVHGGILAVRDDQAHQREVGANSIEYIDLVVVNLYPFVEMASKPGASAAELIENIDIGGPSMIRSAAKNFADVAIVTDPADYFAIAEEMDFSSGGLSLATRLRLARKAFEKTAGYDAAIAAALADSIRLDESGESVIAETAPALPSLFLMTGKKVQDLRYGENPHQRAALYVGFERGQGIASAEKLQGKELSYNNFLDLEAASALAWEFEESACVIIKHTNPCGAAVAATVDEAFTKALASDPVSAYGGIIAFNRPVTGAAAELIAKTFFEAVVAPDYSAAASQALAARKNLRLMRIEDDPRQSATLDLRMISGGFLVQDRDRELMVESELRVVSKRRPSDPEMRALRFAWVIAKHVKSNAIVYAREGQLVGVGAGQMSRVDSARFGAMKAVLPLEGTVLASDAYFPFRDGVDEAARAGVTAIIEPGGSIRDEEVITAADEHNLAMVFTGMRHFKH